MSEIEPKWIKDVRDIKENHDKCVDYTNYYNGYSVLEKKDLNNETPEIFLVAGNRTGGKSFFFKRLLSLMRIHHGHKFLWITRKITQVKGAAQSFYGDIRDCDDLCGEWDVDSYVRNVTAVLYHGEIIGYFTYINYAADLKEISNMFNDVGCIVKDEFQSETNEYCTDEIIKIRSIHKSVSRGFGKQSRYCPLICMGNQTSILNPYYVALGIHKRLRPDTRFLRGEGYVLQVFFNKQASDKSKASAFERAFGQDEYANSSNENIFMDNTSFILKKDTSRMKPQFSIGIENKWYGVFYSREGFYVCNQKIQGRLKYALDLESHNSETLMMRRSDPIFSQLKIYFDNGKFWFENIECKNACFALFEYCII